MALQKRPYYRLALTDASGKEVELEKALNFSFGYSLNDGSTASITSSLKDAKLVDLTTSPLYVSVRIYRWDDPDDGSTERLVWYGKLFDLDWNVDSAVGTVTLLFRDLASQLQYRLVSRIYSVETNTDASDIMWELIDDTQNQQTSDLVNVGNLGITRGEHPTSKDRMPKKDLQSRTVLDCLVSFAENEDGVDWEISPTPDNNSEGVFNTFYRGDGELYHKGSVVGIPLVLYVGDDNKKDDNNIKSIKVSESGGTYANYILALGAQIEQSSQYYSEAENETQQKAVGLYEDKISETNVSEQSTLDDKAAEEVNTRIQIPKEITLEMLPLQQPRFGTFDVGDIFTVRVKVYDFRDFSAQYRLYKMTVNVNKNGVETLQLTLAVI